MCCGLLIALLFGLTVPLIVDDNSGSLVQIIQAHGGTVDPTFTSRCTHLLCESQVSSMFAQVRIAPHPGARMPAAFSVRSFQILVLGA